MWHEKGRGQSPVFFYRLQQRRTVFCCNTSAKSKQNNEIYNYTVKVIFDKIYILYYKNNDINYLLCEKCKNKRRVSAVSCILDRINNQKDGLILKGHICQYVLYICLNV